MERNCLSVWQSRCRQPSKSPPRTLCVSDTWHHPHWPSVDVYVHVFACFECVCSHVGPGRLILASRSLRSSNSQNARPRWKCSLPLFDFSPSSLSAPTEATVKSKLWERICQMLLLWIHTVLQHTTTRFLLPNDDAYQDLLQLEDDCYMNDCFFLKVNVAQLWSAYRPLGRCSLEHFFSVSSH